VIIHYIDYIESLRLIYLFIIMVLILIVTSGVSQDGEGITRTSMATCGGELITAFGVAYVCV
jgi:hypothetical protein